MADLKPMPKPVMFEHSAVRVGEKKGKKKAEQPVIKVTPRATMPVPVGNTKNTRQNTIPVKGRNFGKTKKKGKASGFQLGWLVNPVVRNLKPIGLVAGVAIGLTVLVVGILSLFNNSVFSIYIGEEHIANVAFSDEIDESYFVGRLSTFLETRENARVLVNENIYIEVVNGIGRGTVERAEAIEELANFVTFQIVGTAITVNGERIAVLRNQGEANEVIQLLQSPFLVDGVEYYSVGFVENVNLVDAVVEQNELNTWQQAFNLLDVSVPSTEEYVVQSGDTLGGIALRHNTTISQIYVDNPTFSPATILRPGDILLIQSTMPLLSVHTVEVTARQETIAIVEDVLDNPTQPSTFSTVLEMGSPGLQEVVLHVTRINGLIANQEEVATRIIEPMIPTRIERGTA